MTLRSLVFVATLSALGGAAHAQVCTGYLPVSRTAATLAAGLDAAGGGSAFGTAVGVLGPKLFGGAFLRERGFGIGGSEFDGVGARRVASDHLVAGLTAGAVLVQKPSGLSLCASAELGAGLDYGRNNVAIHKDYYTGGARLSLGADLHAGSVRLLPTVSAGLMFVYDTEFEGDIVSMGTSTLVPVTLGVGIGFANHFTIQPRVVLPIFQHYSTAFGVLLNWTIGGGPR
jgi:hypothetical protein